MCRVGRGLWAVVETCGLHVTTTAHTARWRQAIWRTVASPARFAGCPLQKRGHKVGDKRKNLGISCKKR